MKANKININSLFYISFFIIIFFNFIGYTKFSVKIPEIIEMRNICISFSIILLFIKLVKGQILKRNLYMFSILLILIILIWVNLKNTFIFLNFMAILFLILNLRGLKLEKVLKFWLMEIFVLMLVVQVFYSLNYLPDETLILGNRDRKEMGYIFTSLSSNFSFQFTLMYLLYRGIKVRYVEIIVLFLTNYYFYSETDTKSAFYFTILTVFLVIIIKNINIHSSVLNFFNKYVLLIGTAIPIGLSYFYDANKYVYNELNRLLTNRLYLGNMALEKNGISIFGQPIDWVFYDKVTQDNQFFYVDSSFLTIVIYYGIILMFILILGYYLVANNKYIKNNAMYSVIFSIVVLHATFDPQFLELVYNPILLYLGLLFYDNLISE